MAHNRRSSKNTWVIGRVLRLGTTSLRPKTQVILKDLPDDHPFSHLNAFNGITPKFGGEPNKFLIRNVKYITSNGKHQYVIRRSCRVLQTFWKFKFSKTEIFQQNGNFSAKRKFLAKRNFFSKTEILAEIFRNFSAKRKFFSKTEIFQQNGNF